MSAGQGADLAKGRHVLDLPFRQLALHMLRSSRFDYPFLSKINKGSRFAHAGVRSSL